MAPLKSVAASSPDTITPITIGITSSEQVCYDVVRAVADVRGVEPLEIDRRLADVVDPDGLESFVALGSSGDGRVSGAVEFDFAECRVRVTCGGEIEVRPL